MTGVFKQLIKKEFGTKKYELYSKSIRSGLRDSVMKNKEVYNDIFHYLQQQDDKLIGVMQQRLNASILATFRISKHYIFVLLAYLAACFFLILQGLVPLVTTVAIIVLSLCFISKTYEFVVNKYCYIDAQIILAYKMALEKILLGKEMK